MAQVTKAMLVEENEALRADLTIAREQGIYNAPLSRVADALEDRINSLMYDIEEELDNLRTKQSRIEDAVDAVDEARRILGEYED